MIKVKYECFYDFIEGHERDSMLCYDSGIVTLNHKSKEDWENGDVVILCERSGHEITQENHGWLGIVE